MSLRIGDSPLGGAGSIDIDTDQGLPVVMFGGFKNGSPDGLGLKGSGPAKKNGGYVYGNQCFSFHVVRYFV